MARSTKKKREKKARVERIVRKVIIVVKMNQPCMHLLDCFFFLFLVGGVGAEGEGERGRG